MRESGLIDILFRGFVFLLIQVLLLSGVVFFGTAQIWIYVGLIITIPLGTPRIQLMIIGLIYGFFVDLFFNTLGLHMASTVLIAFLQPIILKLFLDRAPSSAASEAEYITVKTNGLIWFLSYAGLMFFIHHFTYYLIDAAGFNWFAFTIKKIVFSTFLSVITFLIAIYLFYPSGSKR